MSAPLTKKQQKALAFRSKQKAKKADLPEPDAVPEEDIDDAGDVIDAVVVSKSSAPAEASSSKDRKRKRDEGEAEAVPKKGKGKKTAWDDDEEGEGEEGKKKSKKEVKQRFILFVGEWISSLACWTVLSRNNEVVRIGDRRTSRDPLLISLPGNLDFKTTREEVQKHFKPAVGASVPVHINDGLHPPFSLIVRPPPRRPPTDHQTHAQSPLQVPRDRLPRTPHVSRAPGVSETTSFQPERADHQCRVDGWGRGEERGEEGEDPGEE